LLAEANSAGQATVLGDGAHVIAELHDYLSEGNHPKVLNVDARV
jgi:hypothetical protein